MAGATRVEHPRLLMDKCVTCSGDIFGARGHKQYCSTKCRKAFSRRRIAEAKLAAEKKKKPKKKKPKKKKIKA